MFAAAGKTLGEVQQSLDRRTRMRPASRFPRSPSTVHTKSSAERQTGHNVVGSAGDRRAASAEAVVMVGAHYDHLGHGENGISLAGKEEAGQIHFGADDNASGTRPCSRLAPRWRKQPRPRNIVLAFWSGEELGLLGSRRSSPSRRCRSTDIAAYLNFDMVGRMQDNKLTVQAIGTSPVWAQMIEQANVLAGFNLQLQPDPYQPTDVANFNAAHPCLTFFTGVHVDYHRPSDTADKIDYDDLDRIVAFAAAILSRLDKSDPAAAFTKVDQAMQPNRGGVRIFTGTLPDYSSDAKGLLLSGVVGGGPAEQAGLQKGDVIVEIAGQTIANIYDYTYALDVLKIGQPAKVIYLRNNERKETTSRRRRGNNYLLSRFLPPALAAACAFRALLLFGHERARLPGALAAPAGTGLRRDHLRGEHGLGQLHGGPRRRQLRGGAPGRSRAPAAHVVRRLRSFDWRDRAGHTARPRSPAADLHPHLPVAAGVAADDDPRPLRHRLRAADCADGADGRDVAARHQVLRVPHHQTRRADGAALRHEHDRGDRRRAGRGPVLDSGSRYPRNVPRGRHHQSPDWSVRDRAGDGRRRSTGGRRRTAWHRRSRKPGRAHSARYRPGTTGVVGVCGLRFHRPGARGRMDQSPDAVSASDRLRLCADAGGNPRRHRHRQLPRHPVPRLATQLDCDARHSRTGHRHRVRAVLRTARADARTGDRSGAGLVPCDGRVARVSRRRQPAGDLFQPRF